MFGNIGSETVRMVAMGPHKLSFFILVSIVFALTTDIHFRTTSPFVNGATGLDAKLLAEHVVTVTSSNVRPVNDSSHPVNVTLDITFHGVIEMDEKYQTLFSSVWVRQDEKHQILITDIWLRQEWKNELVKWNPADFGGLEQITVDSSQVWQPDIVLYNNVFEEFDGRMDNVKTRIRILHDGLCYWAAPFVFKTSCHFNVRDFPFDKQQCKLKFGSWQFHSRHLDLFKKQEKAQVAKDKVDNGEWDVTSIDIEKNNEIYSCCPNDLYPDITFVINLQRRSLFYTYNLIIPNFLIALLAFFSFYIPVECGERISFVITVLLSMTVFLLLVAESIPPTSEAVPVIGMYYTSSIIEVALALIATGISLKVYYSHLYGAGLSPGIKKFLFYRLAPLLCVDTEIAGKNKRHKKKKSCLGNPFSFLKKLKVNEQRSNDVSMYNVTENPMEKANGIAQNSSQKNDANLLSVEVRKTSMSDIGDFVDPHDEFSDQELRQRFKQEAVSSELKIITSAVKDQKESEKLAAESRIAAAIVDRAFMVLFVVVFCLSTLLILCLPFIKNP